MRIPVFSPISAGKPVAKLCLLFAVLMLFAIPAKTQTKKLLRQELTLLRTERSKLEIRLIDYDMKIAALKMDSTTLQNNIAKLKDDTSSKAATIQVTKSIIISLSNERTDLENDIKKLDSSIKLLQQDTLSLHNRLITLESKYNRDITANLRIIRQKTDSIQKMQSFLEVGAQKGRIDSATISRLNIDLTISRRVTDSLRNAGYKWPQGPVIPWYRKMNWWQVVLLGLIVGFYTFMFFQFIKNRRWRRMLFHMSFHRPYDVRLKCLVVDMTEKTVVAKVLIREDKENPVTEIRKFERRPIEEIVDLHKKNPIFNLTINTKVGKKEFLFTPGSSEDLHYFKEKPVDPDLAEKIRIKLIENESNSRPPYESA